MEDCTSYHEGLLHWIWESRQLSEQLLQTQSGKQLTIHEPGRRNSTEGPDFKNAKITMGKLTWYGDVEIHWKAEDWFRHNHHEDENYKSVVLHVIFSEKRQNTRGEPHAPPLPTLCLKPYLSQPMDYFFEKFQCGEKLPCAKNITHISAKTINRQIEKAHREYFEQKVDDLLYFYDPERPPSEAWQQLVIIGMFDSLGIAHNREPMKKLARLLLTKYESTASLQNLTIFALKKAGISSNNNSPSFNWKRKGSRPTNHPEVRIKQGCALLRFIKETPFKQWFGSDIHQSFHKGVDQINCRPGLGSERAGILFGTVWLPAIYLLGDLFGSKKLAADAQQAWFDHHTSLPPSVTRPFKQAGVPGSAYRQKLGTVHQLRSYCRPHQCHRCEVFKQAINA